MALPRRRHKLLNVQRLLPRVQQQLQGHVTKAEARDMLAAIAQPEVAALQREIRAAGHRLQRMSLPRAGEAVPVDLGDRAGVGASSGGASDTAAAGGAGADAAHGSVDEAMTRAWKSVLGQVAASLEVRCRACARCDFVCAPLTGDPRGLLVRVCCSGTSPR